MATAQDLAEFARKAQVGAQKSTLPVKPLPKLAEALNGILRFPGVAEAVNQFDVEMEAWRRSLSLPSADILPASTEEAPGADPTAASPDDTAEAVDGEVIEHDHAGLYAPLVHQHNYAATNHLHDGRYSLVDHTHPDDGGSEDIELAALGLANHVFIASNRSDGREGKGTQGDPYNGSSRERFDTLMAAIPAYSHIHLLGGTFLTMGRNWQAEGRSGTWQVKAGWRVEGAGRDITTVKLVQSTLVANEGYALFGNPVADIVDAEICDLTLDGDIFNRTSGVKVDGVNLSGEHNRIRRVRAKNCGTSNGTIEAFILMLVGQRVAGTKSFGLLVEDSIVESCFFGTKDVAGPLGNTNIHVAIGHNASLIRPTVRRCVVDGRKATGNGGEPDNPNLGIAIYGQGAVVEDCLIHGTSTGIWTDTLAVNVPNTITIRNNQFRNLFYGVRYELGVGAFPWGDITVENCQFDLHNGSGYPDPSWGAMPVAMSGAATPVYGTLTIRGNRFRYSEDYPELVAQRTMHLNMQRFSRAFIFNNQLDYQYANFGGFGLTSPFHTQNFGAGIVRAGGNFRENGDPLHVWNEDAGLWTNEPFYYYNETDNAWYRHKLQDNPDGEPEGLWVP